MKAFLALPWCLLAGCIADDPERLDPEDLQSETSELTGTSSWNWGSAASVLTMVPQAGKACALTGIGGNINGRGGVAGVFAGDSWGLYAKGSGKLRTWARCFNSTSHSFGYADQFAPRVDIAPAAAGRRCFLLNVDAPTGHFGNSGDIARVKLDDGTWYVEVYGAIKSAFAGCVTVTEDFGEWYAASLDDSESVVAMAPATAGNVCFLTQVSGKIDNPADESQGPIIRVNASTNKFELHVKNGSSGKARCVR